MWSGSARPGRSTRRRCLRSVPSGRSRKRGWRWSPIFRPRSWRIPRPAVGRKWPRWDSGCAGQTSPGSRPLSRPPAAGDCWSAGGWPSTLRRPTWIRCSFTPSSSRFLPGIRTSSGFHRTPPGTRLRAGAAGQGPPCAYRRGQTPPGGSLWAYDKVTAFFSGLCNVRVIWGGDETVRRIRAIPLPPHALDWRFPESFRSRSWTPRTGTRKPDQPRSRQSLRQRRLSLSTSRVFPSPKLVYWRGSPEEVERARKRLFGRRSNRLPRSRRPTRSDRPT